MTASDPPATAPANAPDLDIDGATDSPVPSTSSILKRQLTTLPVIGLIYFSVSGGPYGLEEAISSAGPGMALLMLLIVPVVFSVPCALMAAELASALPVEGGYYYWVKLALGKFAAFVEGIWQWLNSFLDTALYPIVFADYLATWVPWAERGKHVAFSFAGDSIMVDTHWLVAIAFMVPLAILTARGSRLVGDTSTLMMGLVLLPFVLISVLGLWRLFTTDGANPISSFTLSGQHAGSAFGAGLGIIVWNYIGWEQPSTVLGEVRNPARTYGRALAIAVPLITISYLLPMLGALSSPLHAGSPADWADGDFASVGQVLAGGWLKLIVTIGAVISQVGLFSALLMSGSRVPRVLAGDRYLPRWVARDHSRFGTPVGAIITSCVIFSVFCAMDFSSLIDADILTNLAAILLEFAAFLVLRRTLPDLARPFRVPGGWPVALLITTGPVIVTGWLLWSTFTEEQSAFWTGIIVLLVGLLLYPICRMTWKRGLPDGAVKADHIDLGGGLRPTTSFENPSAG